MEQHTCLILHTIVINEGCGYWV